MADTVDDLNTALRGLIDAVRTADLEGVDVSSPVRSIRALTDDLAPHRVDGIRMQAGLRMDQVAAGQTIPMEGREMVDPVAFFPYSPVVGRRNPISPPATFRRVDGEHGYEIHGDAELGAAYNGPPGSVHGGIIALVFDELLGCVCVSNGLGGFTGTLTVIYRNLTPLEAPLTLRGWHDRTEGRKIFAKGTLHHGDTLCAEAEGIFIRSEMDPR
ncbi:MAG: PaaI family thioesterase [Acidimicrobiales bacterium]